MKFELSNDYWCGYHDGAAVQKASAQDEIAELKRAIANLEALLRSEK